MDDGGLLAVGQGGGPLAFGQEDRLAQFKTTDPERSEAAPEFGQFRQQVVLFANRIETGLGESFAGGGIEIDGATGRIENNHSLAERIKQGLGER